MSKFNNKKNGISILGVLVLGVVIILVLSYFHISIKSVVESPTGQENLNYIGEGSKNLWNDYLAQPASYLWNDVWIKIFWNPFIYNMERIDNNQPTNIDNATPKVNLQP